MHRSLSAFGGSAATAGHTSGRRRRSLLSAAVLSVALVALIAAPAFAIVAVQDQGNTVTAGNTTGPQGGETAQVFTAGISGTLTKVQLYCTAYGSGSTFDHTVNLYHASGGLPTTNIAASDSSNGGSSACDGGGWVDFTFTTPVTVAAGTQYAIVAFGISGYGKTAPNPYAAGAKCDFSGTWACSETDDYLFTDFVAAAAETTPAPTPVVTQPPTDTLPVASDPGRNDILIFGFVLMAAVAILAVAAAPRPRGSRRD